MYIKNISTGAIEIVSVDNSGVEGDEDSYNASLSSDGSYVAIESDVALVTGGTVQNVMCLFHHHLHHQHQMTPPLPLAAVAVVAVVL